VQQETVWTEGLQEAVDDYWIEIDNDEDDPYITNGWIVHNYEVVLVIL
jgi:hypothetical protein